MGSEGLKTNYNIYTKSTVDCYTFKITRTNKTQLWKAEKLKILPHYNT